MPAKLISPAFDIASAEAAIPRFIVEQTTLLESKTDDTFDEIIEKIRTNQTLEKLKIKSAGSNKITEDQENRLLKAIETNTSLKELSLEICLGNPHGLKRVIEGHQTIKKFASPGFICNSVGPL